MSLRSVISGKSVLGRGGLWEGFSVERSSEHLKKRGQDKVERGRRSAHSSISAASRREWRTGGGSGLEALCFALQMGNV